jgi:hypothetical protein
VQLVQPTIHYESNDDGTFTNHHHSLLIGQVVVEAAPLSISMIIVEDGLPEIGNRNRLVNLAGRNRQ